jgi:hypothetical protein
VASSIASAILPVLFSGNDSALMMSASDIAANAGDKLRHKTKLQSWKKRFMGVSPEGGQKAWAMVQDLLIQTYVYLHADPFTNACESWQATDQSSAEKILLLTHIYP